MESVPALRQHPSAADLFGQHLLVIQISSPSGEFTVSTVNRSLFRLFYTSSFAFCSKTRHFSLIVTVLLWRLVVFLRTEHNEFSFLVEH